MADAFPASPWSANSTWYPGQAPDQPEQPTGDWTSVKGQDLPNGLAAPPELPPPQLPGGLNVPPDLPHPQVLGPSMQLPPPQPQYPQSAFMPTPPETIHAMAAAAAPHIGVDPMKAPDFSEATPTDYSQEPYAIGKLRSRLQMKATGEFLKGAAAQAAEGFAAIPGALEEATKQASLYQPAATEPPVKTPTDVAMMMAGARILGAPEAGLLGGAPEEGLTLGAGPGRGPSGPPPRDLMTIDADIAATKAKLAEGDNQFLQMRLKKLSQERLEAGYANRVLSPPPADVPLQNPNAARDAQEALDKAAKARAEGNETKAKVWEDIARQRQSLVPPPSQQASVTPIGKPVQPATPEEHIASITGREPPTVVRDKSVPYLAGSSTDGSTIYIDPRVPKQMDVGAPQPIDPAHPLAVHEGVEHELMTRQGMPYESAHRVALGEERKVVEQMGGDWTTYQDQMHKLAEQTEKEPAKNLPPDLYAKPYAHTDLYPKVEAAEKPVDNKLASLQENYYEAGRAFQQKLGNRDADEAIESDPQLKQLAANTEKAWEAVKEHRQEMQFREANDNLGPDYFAVRQQFPEDELAGVQRVSRYVDIHRKSDGALMARVSADLDESPIEKMRGLTQSVYERAHAAGLQAAGVTKTPGAVNLTERRIGEPFKGMEDLTRRSAGKVEQFPGKETIRNAAIRYKGNVYEAPNHVLAGDKAHDALGFTPIGPDGAEDGFVTSQGRFVDRAEANKIAGGADQLRPDRADRFKPGLMRAEDLTPTAAPAVTKGIAAGKKGLAETVQDQVDAARETLKSRLTPLERHLYLKENTPEVIPGRVKEQLSKLGYTPEQIDKMTPQQARDAAQADTTPPRPPGQSPPPSPPHGGGGPSLPARPTAQFVRSLEDRLHTINTRDAGRREMLRKQLDLTKGFTDEMGRNIQDARERGRVDTLTPEEQEFNRSWIDPLHERTTASKNVIRRINGEQSGVEPEELNDPNYMHRSLIGKTPGMDEASGLGDVVGYSGRRRMSTSPPSLRGRSIFAMEDEAGNRKVVTAYPGGDGVYSWGNGKFKVEPGSFIRTRPGEEIPGKEIPGRTTLERPVPARVTKEGGLSEAYYKEPKQIADRITFDKETPPELMNDYFRPGSEFVDMNNKRWFMKQATTREIHDAGVRSSEPETYQDAEGNTRFRAGPPLRFYDNALVNEIVDHLNTEKARDTAETLREFRNEPEFKRYSVRSDLATPEQKRDMVPITAPGFEGRLFDRLYADPLNDYLNGAGWRIPYLDRMSNWVTKWMFKTGIGSLAHLRNEFWQRYQARGWGNLNAVARYKTFWQAMDETRNQGPIWQDYRNRGASFPSDHMHWNSLEQQILKTMGSKLADDPGMKGFFQRLGVTNHEGANMLEYGIGKAVFEIGDFMALQHGLELERRGFTRDQAIQRMNRTLPTYRMPSRVGTQGALGRGASKVLATPSTIQFGRFEYTKFKGLSSVVEDMLGSRIAGRLDKDERLDAIGRAAAIAVAVGVIGPFLINRVARGVTGDPNAHYLYGGSIGMLARFLREADNVVTGKKNLIDGLMGMADVTNIAPMLKELAAQAFNADPYTGRPITGKGVGTGTALFERLGHAAPSVFNPAEAIQRPGQYFLGGLSGVSTAKPYTPIVTRRDLINNMRIYGKTPGSGLMGTIGRFVHPGGYGGTQ